MLHVSHETREETERRLLKVIALSTVIPLEGAFVFEETPIGGPPPELDEDTVALVRDDEVWSRLVRDSRRGDQGEFGLVRFHFPEDCDDSGFVGWLASHLKRTLGTGVFVVCGQNSASGGIFDYSGFPIGLRDSVLEQIAALRAAGTSIVERETPDARGP